MQRSKEQALADPKPGDQWRKGGEKWADEGCELIIDRWEGTSGVFSQAGLMSKMFLCNWDANMPAKFRRWAATAEFLGGAETGGENDVPNL